MKSYFQSFYKILVSIFNYFFHGDTCNHKITPYERLLSASLSDSIELYIKQFHNETKSSKNITEPPVSEQKEPILYQAPPIPDIKKQFKIWSDNMKEYDALRKRLIDMNSIHC